MADILRNITVFLVFISAAGAFADTNDSLTGTPAGPLRIAHVYYNGNHVTKERIIRMFTGLDTGMVFDSLKARKAKKRLDATNLFLKVAIIHLVKNDAVDLYIIVKEPYYINPSSVDFTPQSSKYGQQGTWYCPMIGGEHTNFMGRMEYLKLSLRFLEWHALWPPSYWLPSWSKWRSASAYWSKPLLPSKYSIGIGAFGDNRPDNAIHLDRLEYGGSLTAGRRFFDRSKAYCSIIPDYQRKIVWHDTSVDTSNYYQAFTAMGWYTDRRSSNYDPSGGWSLFLETRSNVLYHEKTTPSYVQFTSDIKAYHQGLFKNHKAAYRLSVISRTNDAGIQNRLVLGGLGSVRGYANCGIDLQSTSNHSLLLCWEYRFPLYQLPPVSPPLPSKVSTIAGKFIGDLTDLAPRIDGALIADYGRVARNWNNVFSLNGHGYRSGIDVGLGIRIMEPTKRWSLCFDVVWVENPFTKKIDFSPTPSPCLYLNLPF